VVWTPERVEHWRATGERPEVAVWTAAQTAQFRTAARGHRLYAVCHLIALRGLRRGEAAGLRWWQRPTGAITKITANEQTSSKHQPARGASRSQDEQESPGQRP
jgi:hypothetical protein